VKTFGRRMRTTTVEKTPDRPAAHADSLREQGEVLLRPRVV